VVIVFAGVTAFGGFVTLLAGIYGLRTTRGILADGEPAVALVKRGPVGSERPLLQFETADGRLLEIVAPVTLDVGSTVILLYDPADPRDIALPDHRRTRLDQSFVVAGAAAMLIAVTLVVTSL
jgi:hypothetical protein